MADVHTNLFGTAAVTLAFLPLLRLSPRPRIWMVTTRTASIADPLNLGTHAAGYQTSKCALGMWTFKLARVLEAEGFAVVSVSPGWFSSEMGGAQAERTPAVAAKDV